MTNPLLTESLKAILTPRLMSNHSPAFSSTFQVFYFFFSCFLLFKFPFYSKTIEVTAIPRHLPHGNINFLFPGRSWELQHQRDALTSGGQSNHFGW